jgi:hypothetical protein
MIQLSSRLPRFGHLCQCKKPELKFPYKNYPNPKSVSGQEWFPLLNVRIGNPGRHSPPTKRFEALLDSGASRCLFHSGFGASIGLDVRKGEIEETLGVSGNATLTYLHPVSLYVMDSIIKITAGFADELPFGGLLGRMGFFEHFRVTFDPASEPPGLDLERIHKA